jgi:hypothetical protein
LEIHPTRPKKITSPWNYACLKFQKQSKILWGRRFAYKFISACKSDSEP